MGQDRQESVALNVAVLPSSRFRNVLQQYVACCATSLEASYSWNVPQFENYALTGTPMERSVQLRRILAREWATADMDRRRDLVHWYVATFGGVRGNKPDTIAEYAEKSDSHLIAAGRKGVASWSKVLAIRAPEKYAIFDARVSFALNALASEAGEEPMFPNLQTQNRLIRKAQGRLRLGRYEKEFYPLYLRLAAEVGSRVPKPPSFLGNPTELVEMVLFSGAEQLASAQIIAADDRAKPSEEDAP